MLDEGNCELVGSALQPDRGRFQILLVAPMMPKQDPRLLTALQHNFPGAVVSLVTGRFAVKVVLTLFIDQQDPGPSRFKSLRSSQPLALGVVHRQTVAERDIFHLRWSQLETQRRNHGRNGTVFAIAMSSERSHRFADLPPHNAAAVDREFAVETG